MELKVHVRRAEPVPVAIRTDFIRLQDFLKLADAVGSGGEAKLLIQDGRIRVGEEIETRRGRKLRPGDIVSYQGKSWKVTADEA